MAVTPQKTKTSSKPTEPKAHCIFAVGRRRTAIARVRLFHKDKKDQAVDIIVNDKPVGQCFSSPLTRLKYATPFVLTNTLDKYKATVKVVGSGLESQLDAIMHGISRALVKADEVYKPVLRANGLLTRDDRRRQKRMIGKGGKARAQKQSPKR